MFDRPSNYNALAANKIVGRIKQFLTLVFALALPLAVMGQGTFQNLDFEAATFPQSQPSGFVSSTSALPSWTVYLGTVQQGQVTFNNPSAGSTWVSLLGTPAGPFPYSTIEGNFSVLLQGGVTAPNATVGQTGLIPITAQSVRFKAKPGTGALLITFGGVSIPFVSLSATANYALYGGDISAFAGQSGDLRFSALNQGASGPNDWNLDSIVFSNQQIPEPGTFGMFGLGVLIFGCRSRLVTKT